MATLPVRSVVDLAASSRAASNIIHLNVRSLKVKPLTARLSQQLPKPSAAFRSLYASSISAPVSLTDFRRKQSQAVLAYASQRKEIDGMSQEEVVKALRPETSNWKDPASYTLSYHELVDDPDSPVQYSRAINMANVSKPFPLKEWVDLHMPVCQTCQDHHARHGGLDGFFHHNARNECPFADVLSWLSGEWRIPLASMPPKAALDNYPSLYFDIPAITKEIKRMNEWGTIVRSEAHLIHPAMGVVKDSDVREACRILVAIGRPSPSEDKQDIAIINDHIRQVLAKGVTIPEHLGELKIIPVCFCFDGSKLLNGRVKDWKFQFAKVHDFVQLLNRRKKGSFMARIDLHKYFNQLPLHPDDWGMVGIRLPKDLQHMEKDLEEWISAFAQFGGKPFPAYANAVMAAICFILRAHGIDCVFMTDDIGIHADTKEECEALLAKAVASIRRLGLKIQDSKLIHPAQVMPFLGISIDTVNERLSIPLEKLESILRFIYHLLEAHASNNLVAKDLESLLGKLGWIVEVMIAGKAHLRALRKSPPSWWFHPTATSTPPSPWERKLWQTSSGGALSSRRQPLTPSGFPSGPTPPLTMSGSSLTPRVRLALVSPSATRSTKGSGRLRPCPSPRATRS